MNHAGEITPLIRLVRPHVAIVTTVEPVHLEFFGSLETIADAKAEIFLGVEPGGAAVLNRDNRAIRAARSAAPRRPASRASSRSAQHEGADARLIDVLAAGRLLDGRMPTSSAQDVTYKLGTPGRHLVLNSLAVLAAASLVGADLALAALALAAAQAGRRPRRAAHARLARAAARC